MLGRTDVVGYFNSWRRPFVEGVYREDVIVEKEDATVEDHGRGEYGEI